MSSKQTEVKEETPVEQIIDEFDGLDVEKLLPTMTVDPQLMAPPKEECIVGDDKLLGLYEEILGICREDRNSVDEILTNMLDMVMNDGDSSPASKEAIVNLAKIKADTADKMTKVADLMTRIKLKDKDTFPRYLAAQQNNKVVIESSQRELLQSINKMTNNKLPNKKGGNAQ